ncbi:hypothetical protein ACGFY3_30075 [Streptomyces mirabilis]|uniref:hypothetical protein n=1 Tax=Streptomyces mirabilis TaxID=68239 RepID=UPI00371C3726
MNDLLEHVISAHGGRERWLQIGGLRVEATLHGSFWAVRGFSDEPFEETVTIDTRRELIRFKTFYFGDDGLLRRLDYDVDVNTGVAVAHYVSDYRTFEGIQVPTWRRVHRRNADNSAGENWSIGIDINRVMAV